MFLPIFFGICLGCSKEPSHRDRRFLCVPTTYVLVEKVFFCFALLTKGLKHTDSAGCEAQSQQPFNLQSNPLSTNNSNWWPIKIYNEQSHPYCWFYMYGRIHQYKKYLCWKFTKWLQMTSYLWCLSSKTTARAGVKKFLTMPTILLPNYSIPSN